MPIDKDVYFKPAVRRDAGTPAIMAAVGLMHVAEALEALARGNNPDEAIKKIRDQAGKLEAHFDEMSGWKHGE